MEIEKQATDAEIHISLAGEITLASVGRLQAELRDCLESGCTVVLNLEHVTEIDIAGLQLLLAAGRSFAVHERPLIILRGTCVERVWAEAGFPSEEVSSGEDNHDRG
jgi:anti-anti-sigma factor